MKRILISADDLLNNLLSYHDFSYIWYVTPFILVGIIFGPWMNEITGMWGTDNLFLFFWIIFPAIPNILLQLSEIKLSDIKQLFQTITSVIQSKFTK